MMGWVKIAGLGPGDAGLVTPEVTAALRAATDVVGYIPYVRRAGELLSPFSHLSPHGARLHPTDNRVELDRALHALQMAAEGGRVAVVSSGDPGVFAMASAVFEALEAHPEFANVPIEVLPGITAMLAAAARAGAPLGHDFCAINLSDNLKPFDLVLRRVRLAAEGDFAMGFYNPRSASRPHQFGQVLDALRQAGAGARLITFARAVSMPEESLLTVTIDEATEDMADMRTVVLVGNSATRRVGNYVYTPRSA
jgi:precorrin-3B C17-methyltransferase